MLLYVVRVQMQRLILTYHHFVCIAPMPCVACYLYFSSGVILFSGRFRAWRWSSVPRRPDTLPCRGRQAQPHISNPSFTNYFTCMRSTIFCCSYSCMWYLPTLPFHCSQHDLFGLLRIARAVLVVYAQLLLYMVGELSPEVNNWFRNIGDDLVQLMMTMRT